MKWSHKSREYQDKSVWHDWFAWFPVCVKYYAGGGKDVVWLERVKRKGRFIGGRYGWDYRYKL